MASLSLTNAEVVRAVLQVTGLGRDPANLDVATEADVRHIIRSGLKRFFFPTQGDFAYQWRWLEKSHSVSAEPKFSAGTVEVVGGTVTLTGDIWPADIVDYFISVGGHVLFVNERDSDTEITVSHTQIVIAAGAEFEAYRYRYPLPANFSEWQGGVVYTDGAESWHLSGSSESELRLRYAVGQGLNTRTTHYFVDADASKILFWPVPLPPAFISGTYLSVPDDNLPADLTSPGPIVQVGPKYSEAVLEAILSVAEEYMNDMHGVHTQRFQVALNAAIVHDRSVGGAYDFSRPVTNYRGLGPVINSIDFWD